MSPRITEIVECAECARWRDAYWRAIRESVRLEERLKDTPNGLERERRRLEHEAAERVRISVREIFLKHKLDCHDR